MVNPSKLKALVDTQTPMAAIANPSIGAVEPDGDEAYDDEEEEAETLEETGDPLARGNDLLAQWGSLGEALKEEAGELVDGAHDVGSDLLLSKIPEESIDEVEASFDRMPEELQWALAKYVAKLSSEDVTAVATALLDGQDGSTADPDLRLVTVYLQQLAQFAAQEVDPADIPEEEESEEDESDEESSDEAPADGPESAGSGETVSSSPDQV